MTNEGYRRRTDEAIDRAVRDLMEVDPAAGFRRRVLSRLERPSLAGWLRARRTFWIPLGAAAAVLLAVAVLVPLNDGDIAPAPAPSAPSLARSAPSPAPPAPPVPRSAPSAIRSAPSPARSAPSPARPTPSPFAVFNRGRVAATTVDRSVAPAVDSLATPEFDAVSRTVPPIEIAPLAPVDEIRVAPIVVPRLTVPSLLPLQRGER